MAEQIDDFEDLYGPPSEPAVDNAAAVPSSANPTNQSNALSHAPHASSSMIPGLGMLGNAPTVARKSADAGLKDEADPMSIKQEHTIDQNGIGNAEESNLHLSHPVLGGNDVEAYITENTPPDVEQARDVKHEILDDTTTDPEQEVLHFSSESGAPKTASGVTQTPAPMQGPESTVRPKGPVSAVDGDFLEVAKKNRDDEAAEFAFDSSDETSSSDSNSDTSSDDDSDDGDLLDPAAMAKILMAEGGGDDEDGGQKKSSGNFQLRTKNEKPPEVIPKPDVTVTPEMKITPLGTVEAIADNFILVKGHTSGEYQVLEQASVLCLEDRTVIGAVAETLGRVHNPLYSVAFTTAQEISDAGINKGTEIFYVDGHSTFVFTQPLKNMKYTDASNDNDEEVGMDEMDFSDDEAELAYKRAKKEAKRSGRAGDPGMRTENGAFDQVRSEHMDYDDVGTAHAQGQSQPINYDDGDGDEMYTPLSRPSNLQDMMASRPPPLGQRAPRPGFERGRGRGRGDRGGGRGDRGGRGRGDRGRGDRGRGGRGNRGGSDNARSRGGPSNSFPDQHNGQPAPMPSYQTPHYPQPSLQPQQPSFPMPQYNQQGVPSPQPYQVQHQQAQNGTQNQQAQFPPQMLAWAQFMQQQQQQPAHAGFNATGNTNQYATASPAPGGAFVNPNFFANQQAQQAYNVPPPSQNGPQGGNAAIQAMQQQLEYWRRQNQASQ